MTTVRRIGLYQLDVTTRSTWLVVTITTDDELVGVGECSDATMIDQVPAAVAEISTLLLGKDLSAGFDTLDRRLWSWSRTPDPAAAFMRGTVVGGLSTAACDILAQADGVPLWKWLGGESATLPLYANINRSTRSRAPQEFAELATEAVAAGFDTVKLAPFGGAPLHGRSIAESGLARLTAVRSAVGDHIRVLADTHHLLPLPELLDVLPALAELRLGWLEDAVDVHSPEALGRVAAATSIPLAGGERIVDPDQLTSVLRDGHLRYLLLDPKYAGGPLRLRRLLGLVENVSLTFHNPTGPIGTAAASHLGTLPPGCDLLEYAFGEGVDRSAVAYPAEEFTAAGLRPSDAPGLGVQFLFDSPLISQRWEWSA